MMRRRLFTWLVLLCFQLVWSYHRMQTLGFLMVMSLWKKIPGPRDPRASRHLWILPFSTHPLLAPFLLGRMMGALEEGKQPGEAQKVVLHWMGSFGAFGDVLYWHGLLWCSVSLALLLWFLSSSPLSSLILLLLLVLLEIALRPYLFELGRRYARGVAQWVKEFRLQTLRAYLPLSGWAGGILLLGVMVFSILQGHPGEEWLPYALPLLAGGALAIMTRFRSAILWGMVIGHVVLHLLR